MTDQQKGLVTLIRSALDGKSYELPQGFSMEKAVNVALQHKIIALVYYGAVNCGVDKSCEPMKKLFPYLIATMNVVQKQIFARERLLEAFRESKIAHMPLKGSVIQSLYPKPEMRTMGDLDVLIQLAQYDKIKLIMNELGYIFAYESDHELVWKRGQIEVELHKRVMTSYNHDFYTYLGDGWKFAKEIAPCQYVQTDEDFYVYMFVHFTKHYRISGIGIRHLVDLWVYRQAKNQLDMEYVGKQLRFLKLDTFHAHVEKTLDAWFADQAHDRWTQYISEVIFLSGEYGTADSVDAAKILREAKQRGSLRDAKTHSLWHQAFLPFRQMRAKYKILRYLPFLLPVFWVVRWFDVLLFKRRKLNRFIRNYKSVDERAKKHMDALAFVGLDFYTQEQLEK